MVQTVLNVAEKPSVARSLAQIFDTKLSRQRNSNGSENVRGIMNYTAHAVEFPVNNQTAQQRTMITTAVRGHVTNLEFAPEFKSWSGTPPSALFDAPVTTDIKDDMKPIVQNLKQLSRRAQILILWLDCDREGEHISAEVRDVCLQGNRNLMVFRARFSTVLQNEITRALFTLDTVNEAQVSAVEARMELDLRIGAAFTRWQSMFVQNRFDISSPIDAADILQNDYNNAPTSHHQLVSYGPCQFPTLGFVCERWARIETFVPETFWFMELSVKFDDKNSSSNNTQNSKTIYFKWKRDRLYDHILAMVLYESCLEDGTATVIDLKGMNKSKWRPLPLSTVELQKRASKYLRIGSETFMAAAEALYNEGLISYPRTETEIFRDEFDHKALLQTLSEGALANHEMGQYAAKLVNQPDTFQQPRRGQKDDQAHPPITPCRAIDPNSITDHHQRGLYTLVTKHYLACCSKDAIGKETELTVKMSSEYFFAKGLMIQEENWLEIYKPWERWSTGQGLLPVVEIGSQLKPTSFFFKEGATTPPPYLSEVELITLMDRNGIGTDATIAQHIATIIDRSYAEKDNQQRFHPTKLGIALVEGYNSMGYKLNRPDLRRETEAECNRVAAGQKTKEEIMAPILQKMRECYDKVSDEAHKLETAIAKHFRRIGSNQANATIIENNFSNCGVCAGKMVLKAIGGTNNNVSRRRNNSDNQAKMKLLYCLNCEAGYKLPRGVPEAVVNNNSNTGVNCPICNFQVLKICKGEGYEGNGYNICPCCFSKAPKDFGGNGLGSFQCFSCTHKDCSLALSSADSSVEVFQCSFCHSKGKTGSITLNKREKGYILSCSNYRSDRCNYSIWLPREAQNISIAENNISCQSCCQSGNYGSVVRKLHFIWKLGSLPPYFDRQYVACVLCDPMLKEDMGLRIPQINQVTIHSNRGEGASRRSNHNSNNSNRSGRGARVNNRITQNNGTTNNTYSCFKCGISGHFANNCPNS